MTENNSIPSSKGAIKRIGAALIVAAVTYIFVIGVLGLEQIGRLVGAAGASVVLGHLDLAMTRREQLVNLVGWSLAALGVLLMMALLLKWRFLLLVTQLWLAGLIIFAVLEWAVLGFVWLVPIGIATALTLWIRWALPTPRKIEAVARTGSL